MSKPIVITVPHHLGREQDALANYSKAIEINSTHVEVFLKR